MNWVDEWRKTPPSPNAGEVVSTNWPTASTHRDLPVPDEVLRDGLAHLEVCGFDRHQHEPTAACVLAIAAPVVAAVLRQLVAQADEDRGSGGAAYDDGFFDGANTVRDRAEKIADQLDPR